MYSLRALEPEDLDLVYQIENDATLWAWGATTVPYSRYALRQYIAEQSADIYRDGQLRQVVTLDGEPVGLVDLCDFSPHHLRAEVGIVVLPRHQRHGVARWALTRLAQYAGERLHLRSLYAYVDVENLPAQHLFRQLGFQPLAQLPRWIEGTRTATLFQLKINDNQQ